MLLEVLGKVPPMTFWGSGAAGGAGEGTSGDWEMPDLIGYDDNHVGHDRINICNSQKKQFDRPGLFRTSKNVYVCRNLKLWKHRYREGTAGKTTRLGSESSKTIMQNGLQSIRTKKYGITLYTPSSLLSSGQLMRHPDRRRCHMSPH